MNLKTTTFMIVGATPYFPALYLGRNPFIGKLPPIFAAHDEMAVEDAIKRGAKVKLPSYYKGQSLTSARS
jgi:hypothetical protein